ncbi:uncharacterized protein KRP23_5260 [Phytophthora ramorum]|uniref:uncharacterized protein n=1 Tax=Phytophthora ramorum TaxID=164328 RepID=UPI0030AC8E28|nr:hypothetical protein KRP23_5260 [Phytophthora ramorum]
MRRDLQQGSGIFATELFPVTSFQAQQQCDDEVGWTTISERIAPGSSGNKDTFSTVAASLDRLPGSTCIFRVAATTANGQGPFSMASAKLTTLRTAPDSVTNLRVVRDPLTVLWEPPAVLGGHTMEKLTYEVEYRATRSSTWTRLPASLVDNSRRAANISMVALKSYTSFVARVRAIADEDQTGIFSQPSEFLTDYAVEAEALQSSDSRGDLSNGTRQVVLGATRQQAANKQDWYYVQLTGSGGSGGSAGSGARAYPGENGAVLVFPVTWSGERLSERSFFFTGGVQTYRVPSEQHEPQQSDRSLALRIVALDIYAWGAGGAGATASSGTSSDFSNGGGGSFARGLIRVSAGDIVDILVGGGGQEDGQGGYNGGGNGGTGDFAGGGGGGASEVQLNGRSVLVAAGGAGAGSTDYCCAHGGGGGGLEQAEAGLAASGTSIPLDLAVTGQASRDEFHSSNVAGDTRDFEGLPARHQHLDWGFAASSEDYSVLATGGTGASPTAAGLAGTGGSYQYSLEGRKSDAPDPSDASTWGPQAFKDLWELSVSSTTAKQLSVPLDSRQPTNLPIPDGGEVFALGKKSASPSGEQLCVAKVSVSVQITHACPHKLRLQLFGPGPSTFPGRQQSVHFPVDSQARETTWSASQGLGSFQGDHRATGTAPNTRAFPVLLQSPDEAADKIACSSGTKKLSFVSAANGAGTSLESLSVFHQLPVAGNWTLEVADTAADGLVGTLDAWDIAFDLAPCVPAFTWTDLSALSTGAAPTPRFQHSVVVFENSMFVYGGTRGSTGLDLNDVYRLDYTSSLGVGLAPTAKWTQLASLVDSDTPSIPERRVYAGRATLLTPYELMAIGRGLKPPRRGSLGSNKAVSDARFESRLDVRLKKLEDMIDGWQKLTVSSADSVDPLDEQLPVPRYWGASTFVLSPPGKSPPRAFLFGGQDDTTLLDDLWSLDLTQLDEDFPSERVKVQRLRACAWRQENSVYRAQWASSCGASTTAAAVNKCTLEMLLFYAWCEEFYQSILL